MPSRRRGLRCLALAAVLAAAAPAQAAMNRSPLDGDGSHRAVATAMDGPFGATGVRLFDVRHGGVEDISVGEHGIWVAAERPDIDLAARTVVFSSEQGLDPRDANGIRDIYVRDRDCPVAQRVSLGAGGVSTDATSLAPAISGDGRWVAFQSDATNLVPGQDDGSGAIYAVDRATGAVVRVAGGTSASPPAFSADGRFLAFDTTAPLTADDRDAAPDIYVRDLVADRIERIPLGPAEGEFVGPSLSADGRYVVGTEFAGADVWRFDRRTGRSERVSVWPSGPGAGLDPAVSADGSRIAFVGDPDPGYWPVEHATAEIWVRDMVEGTTVRARPGTTPPGPHALPDISADGRWVSWATRDSDGGIYDLGADAERPVPAIEPFAGPCAALPEATRYERAVLADDPAAYWRLGDGADARVARDELQSSDAWPSGAMRRGAPGALAGDTDRGLDLGGAGHLTITENFEFPGRAPFTLEAWIAPRDLNAQTRRIVSMESATTGANGDRGYLLGVRADGVWFQRYLEGRATAVRAPVRAGAWTHVVATYDGERMRLYLDGTERSAAPSQLALLPARHPMTVGAKQGQWLRYRGGLDELAVYRRALPPERVAAHFAAGR
jgi:Tol biopolymer transport system component